MTVTEVAVVPAAFALLTSMLMFASRTKEFVKDQSDTTAVVRVALFLLCTMIAIVIGFAIG